MTDIEKRRARTLEMMKGAREFRTIDTVPELRSAADGTLALRGYASRFGNWYDVGDPERGGFRERLTTGAFTRTLSEGPDVSLVLDHGRSGSGLPLARTTAGNLTLHQDDAGLAVDAVLDPDDPDVALLATKMRSNLISGMSFAFLVTSDNWNNDRNQRTVTGVSLHRGDVSVVVHPANELAQAEMVARAASSRVEVRRPSAERRERERLALLARRDSVRRQYANPRPSSIPDMTTERRERLAAMRREA